MKDLFSGFKITKGVVFFVLAGALMLGEFWFLVTSVPRQISEIGSLQKSQVEISGEISQLDFAVRILTAVDQTKLAKQVASVNAVLPSQKKTSGLVAGIARIASDSGVILDAIDFSPGKISTGSAVSADDEAIPGSLVRRVRAELTISGNLDRLTVFLAKIQAASQLIGIESLNFTGALGHQQAAQIVLQVYYEPVSDAVINWSQVRPVSASEEMVLRTLTSQDVFILPGEGR